MRPPAPTTVTAPVAEHQADQEKDALAAAIAARTEPGYRKGQAEQGEAPDGGV